MSAQADAIHFERSGQGEPLLLVHGLGGSGYIWTPVLERLRAERDVIVVDTPGFGRTPLLDGFEPSAAAVAGVLAEFCERLGVERPHVAGNSLGGWSVLEMAADGNARSACAISPAGLWREPLGRRSYDSRRWAWRLRPLVLALLSGARGRRSLMRTVFGHPERVDAATARRVFSDWLASEGYPRANGWMRELTFDRAGEIDVPVTIAWGDRDRLVGPPRRERMPAQARYLEVEGWGHTPTWDDPDGVARLLLEASAGAGGVERRAPVAGTS